MANGTVSALRLTAGRSPHVRRLRILFVIEWLTCRYWLMGIDQNASDSRAVQMRSGGCVRKSDVPKFEPGCEFTSGSKPL
jgi:hypothetical protein